MVSAPPATLPVSLDFDTSVFKKERVNLAGHEEVWFQSFQNSHFILRI
jgi:hypothetical protein